MRFQTEVIATPPAHPETGSVAIFSVGGSEASDPTLPILRHNGRGVDTFHNPAHDLRILRQIVHGHRPADRLAQHDDGGQRVGVVHGQGRGQRALARRRCDLDVFDRCVQAVALPCRIGLFLRLFSFVSSYLVSTKKLTAT